MANLLDDVAALELADGTEALDVSGALGVVVGALVEESDGVVLAEVEDSVDVVVGALAAEVALLPPPPWRLTSSATVEATPFP